MKALQDKSAVQTPFWVTATWPAHLMFNSLIAQFGGSIYDEEGAKATFNSEAGVEALEWLRSFVDSGASPKNVSNDAQAVAFRQQRNSLTWDGIWMMNEWEKVKDLQWAAAALAHHRRQAGRVGQLAQLRRHHPGDQGPEQARRVPSLHLLHLRALDRVGQVGAGPGPQQRPGVAGVRGPHGAVDAGRPAGPDVVFPPAVPGIGDVTQPTWETAVNEAILGKKPTKAALDAAAKKADAMLKANQAKYQA